MKSLLLSNDFQRISSRLINHFFCLGCCLHQQCHNILECVGHRLISSRNILAHLTCQEQGSFAMTVLDESCIGQIPNYPMEYFGRQARQSTIVAVLRIFYFCLAFIHHNILQRLRSKWNRTFENRRYNRILSCGILRKGNVQWSVPQTSCREHHVGTKGHKCIDETTIRRLILRRLVHTTTRPEGKVKHGAANVGVVHVLRMSLASLQCLGPVLFAGKIADGSSRFRHAWRRCFHVNTGNQPVVVTMAGASSCCSVQASPNFDRCRRQKMCHFSCYSSSSTFLWSWRLRIIALRSQARCGASNQ